MKKALLLAGLLLAPSWSADAPGLSWVHGVLYRENPDPSVPAGLRGSFGVRNDSGADLKNVRVIIHVMDGYGRPIFNLLPQVIPQMKAKQSDTLPIYIPTYNGSVGIFQLGADIDAETPGGKEHFVIAPHDASTSLPGVQGY